MLNIGKLAADGERYYLATVASGVEDYYTGAGEAPGHWLGSASAAVGLIGRVQAAALRRVLGARDPETDEPLTRRASRRTVPGFDCTFRAPKSVSLLYGLGSPDASREVRDAHDAAVAAALGYLEQEAGFSRRRHGGSEAVATTGFVAAAFRHRTSRAGDPLLHTHVLVANVGRAVDDGEWRTLDARRLYVHAKTAGYLYQAHLRAELTRRLGVTWGPVRNGYADLRDVTADVIRAFSRRRVEIEARLEQRGSSSAAAAQAATLATRAPKDRAVTATALQTDWRARAAVLGLSERRVDALLGPPAPPRMDRAYLLAAAQSLAGPEGLTAHSSTFTRRDAIRAWCEQLDEGADVDQALALADRLLDEQSGASIRLLDQTGEGGAVTLDQVIRRHGGQVVVVDATEPRFTTPELLALEEGLISSAAARRDERVAVADATAVQSALDTRPSISGEQGEMVRSLTTSGTGVDVVVGKAGSGKTFALDAARAAWQASGITVIGCALAARASAELQAGSGIPASTIDGLLLDAERMGWPAVDGVLVVDEAGMVGTRKLARLLDHAAHSRTKVVLLGDYHQLPEIDAGGAFRGLVERLPAHELHENRRQREEWERQALDELRTGNTDHALRAYQTADRVVVGEDAETVREHLVSDWWTATQQGLDGVMVAPRVSDVEDLNQRARAWLEDVAALTGPELEAASGRSFRAGDRVVCLANDRRLGVLNGTRATVTAVEPSSRTVHLQLDDRDQLVALPTEYLDAGHLGHAYAVTAHKAQGLTTDRTWVLGSDAVYREWGYVALSRGRESNRLYVVGSEADPDLEEHLASASEHGRDPVGELASGLRRSRGQQLALEQGHPSRGTQDRRLGDRGAGLG